MSSTTEAVRAAPALHDKLPLVTYVVELEAPSPAIYVSPQFEALFGYAPEECTTRSDFWQTRMAPADRPRFLAAFQRMRDTREAMSVEYRVTSRDGHEVWVRDFGMVGAEEDGRALVHGCLCDVTREKELERELAAERAQTEAFVRDSAAGLGITDADGRYVPIEAGGETQYGRIAIDITERRRAERERAAVEVQYRRLIEQLPLVTYVNAIRPVYKTIYVSPQIEMFGYPAELWLEEPGLWDRIVHPDDVEAVRLGEREARARGEPFELEYRVVRGDGSEGWVLDLMETTFDTDGTPLFEQGFLVDVTARKQSEGLFRAVFDNAFEAMTITDDDGRYVDVNGAACELFGRSRAELLELRAVDLSESPAEGEETWRTLLTDGWAAGLHAVVRPDGEVREAEFAAKANVLPGRHVAVLRDVTKRRELEGELSRAQRLESVGRLAGGVAHDFNNMLTAIRGYAELLLARTAPGTAEHHHAQEIDDAANRVATLTAQLLAFGRRQVIQARPLDLNSLVQDLAGMLSRLAGAGVGLEFDLDPALGVVRADPAQVQQVLVNLVANAADAMKGAGGISVRTANADLRGADERPGLPGGRYAVLSVEDSGPGIDPETLEHLFEPFFTTKDVGRGIGLGLATAYGIAQQSDGTITVSSELGVGSTFSVYLPASDAPRTGEAGPTF